MSNNFHKVSTFIFSLSDKTRAFIIGFLAFILLVNVVYSLPIVVNIVLALTLFLFLYHLQAVYVPPEDFHYLKYKMDEYDSEFLDKEGDEHEENT